MLETAAVATELLTRDLPALVVCPVCGATEDGQHMSAVEVARSEPLEIDVGGIVGVREAFAWAVRLEWRCRRCVAGEPAQENVL
jgi:rubredoxin